MFRANEPRPKAPRSIEKPSFRGDAKPRTGNLEIAGLVLTHHPGMTKTGLLRRFAPRNDGRAVAQSYWWCDAIVFEMKAIQSKAKRLDCFVASKVVRRPKDES